MSLEHFKKEKGIILFLGQMEVRLEGVKLNNEGRGMRKEVTTPVQMSTHEADVGQWRGRPRTGDGMGFYCRSARVDQPEMEVVRDERERSEWLFH